MKDQFVSLKTIAEKYSNSSCSGQPHYLVPNLWKEGEVALLHAPRAFDKLSAASSIITEASGFDSKVLYIDVENASAKLISLIPEVVQLQVYTPALTDESDDKDFAELVISAIECAVKECGIRIFVVDSINRIAAASFGRNASPVHIMKKLVYLQMRYGISILVLAHSDSKSTFSALTALANCDISAVDYNTPHREHTHSCKIYSVRELINQQNKKFHSPDMNRAMRRRIERENRKSADPKSIPIHLLTKP